MSTDEFFHTPVTLLPQELVDGVVREAAAAPAPSHQAVVGEVYRRLWEHVQRPNAGLVFVSPIDIVLDKTRGLVVQPDVVVVLNERRHLVTDRIWGAPDLVVEVMSPFPRIGQLDERLRWFDEHGVRECCLVHQVTRQVQVISFAQGQPPDARDFMHDDRIGSRVLPDFDCPADALFP